MLAPETLAKARLLDMTEGDLMQRVKDYVRRRLQDEVRAKPRGAQSAVARKLGTSSAHLANLLSDPPSRQPGEAFCRKAADHWGISYADLERLAVGGTMPPAQPVPAPSLDVLRDVLRDVVREEVAAGVAAALAADREARDEPKPKKSRR